MVYKGYKLRIRCIEWEQVKIIDNFWHIITKFVSHKDIVGLGMNWSDDYLYFDYAIGVIDNDNALEKLKNIDFKKYDISPIYFEIELPEIDEFSSFKGNVKDVKTIYENYIDCYKRPYDYELEYIDGCGNIEIKIHFID